MADATGPAAGTLAGANIQQAVPFFGVSDIRASVRFYVEALGCELTRRWEPEGRLRWCWLQLGGTAIMLQEFDPARRPEGKLGQGVTISFQCQDALAVYRQLVARGQPASRPFVGNGMWVTSIHDPDGYRLEFESPTGEAEETEYPG